MSYSVLYLSMCLCSLVVAGLCAGLGQLVTAAVCTAVASVMGLLAYSHMRSETKFLPADGKAVFITGCDSGFGHATARHLDALGMQVFAGCLFPDGDGASRLSAECSERLRIIPLDVTKQEDIDSAMATVRELTGGRGLWGVVNNAGILLPSELEVTPIETFSRHLDVNLLGQIRVVKGALPLLRKSRGRIVSINSTNSYYYTLTLGAYGISKAAAEMFSNVLRLETRKWRIKVVTVHPGVFKTGLLMGSNIRRHHQTCYDKLSAELKQYYTPEYFEKSWPFNPAFSMPSDLSPVANTVARGLLEREPSNSYRCGQMAGIMIKGQQWLPGPLYDYIVYNSKHLNLVRGLIPEVDVQDNNN